MFSYLKRSVIVVILTIITPTSAFASFVSFDLTWSGEYYGNSASATGLLTLDNSFLPTAYDGLSLPNPAVTALDITVTGTTGGAGDGSWDISSFSALIFNYSVALDLTRELIGQSIGSGIKFGDLEENADFNVFSSVSGAPSGDFFFTLRTNSNESLRVTSMSPVSAVANPVNAPAAAFLLTLGIGGIALSKRKKSQRQK